ncbi:MAG TPA: hypothetical protein VFP06_17935, partial [Acidimicrobiales bacterium]|nr:hypothetical protein [Acidimicrobiales bacterium]
RLLTPPASALDPLRFDRGADAVLARARQLIAAMVDSLPLLGDEPHDDGSIAERLWPRLTEQPPDRQHLQPLDAALVHRPRAVYVGPRPAT